MTRRLTLTALATTALVAALPSAALAHGADRNHDRIPDRWERAHHLSLSRNQARLDQDHDGLRNRAEFRDHTNPRSADSDHDGLSDGAEIEIGDDPTDADTNDDGIRDGQEQSGAGEQGDDQGDQGDQADDQGDQGDDQGDQGDEAGHGGDDAPQPDVSAEAP